MVHDTKIYRGSGLCPLFGILNTTKQDVSETGSVFVLRRVEDGPVIEIDCF
jgi:hypothetical protein